jgi:hypothetical protein
MRKYLMPSLGSSLGVFSIFTESSSNGNRANLLQTVVSRLAHSLNIGTIEATVVGR